MKKYYPIIVFLSALGFNFTLAQTSAGNALNLDGVDQYASPNTANVSGMSEGTIEMWFSADIWNTFNTLWAGGIGHPGANGDLARFASHTTGGNDAVLFGFFAGGWQWANSGITPTPSQWIHVAATWSADGIKIYVNGTLEGSNSYNGSLPSYSIELISASSWGDYLDGQIDELRFWNVVRDSAQINSTMLDTLSADYYLSSDSGLIAYYRMEMFEDLGINGDGADDLRDLSVNANHMDTYGDPTLKVSGAFIITGVEKTSNEIPNHYSLNQNYPNPFNPSTTITFTLPVNEIVSLSVYNMLGEEIQILQKGFLEAGMYSYNFNAKELPSGVYFYRLVTPVRSENRKMLLIK